MRLLVLNQGGKLLQICDRNLIYKHRFSLQYYTD